MTYKNLISPEFHHLPLSDVIKLEVDALISIYGFRGYVVDTLKVDLRVISIFDLATSQVFNNAYKVCNPSSEDRLFLETYGLISADIIKKDAIYNIDKLCDENLKILTGVDEHAQIKLKNNLNLTTIHDLANWAPFLQAKQLVEGENNDQNNDDYDLEIPDELVPKFNQYPVDSFSYSIYTMMPTTDTNSSLKQLDAPLDLEDIDFSLKNLPLRVGGIIRFEQTWTSKGLALGDLLHSLPLAPGESTKIAIIDWTRQQGVKLTEDISQAESLSNSVMQTRSLNEVTRAVAQEAQSGFSKMNSNATVSNSASSTTGMNGALSDIGAAAGVGALGGAIGGGVAGTGIGAATGSLAAGIGALPGAGIGALIGVGSGAIIGGVAGGATALSSARFGGEQNSDSTSELETVTTTSSSGKRTITAEMTQNITDRTRQHASSARSKKASIVQEVSQKESEKITTRAVTNYNHMHALTIQYFEVVQLFKEETFVKAIDPCIFIPFKNITTWNDALIEKYKSSLISSALNINFLYSLIYPKNNSYLSLDSRTLSYLSHVENRHDEYYEKTIFDANKKLGSVVATTIFDSLILDYKTEFLSIFAFGVYVGHGDPGAPDQRGSYTYAIDKNNKVIKLNESEEDDSKGIKLFDLKEIRYKLKFKFDNSNTNEIFPKNMKEYIHLCKVDGEDYYKLYSFLSPSLAIIYYKSGNVKFEISIPVPCFSGIDINYSKDEIDVCIYKIFQSESSEWQINHLNDNANYYTSKVFRNFSDAEYSAFLSPYSYADTALIDAVDPRPKAISGNYLIFKLRETTAKHYEWVKELVDKQERSSSLIPIPTGGVFAEAIQGRANSAEKLDISRFWNWQDSPIPNQAPDIAPIQSGSRATDPNVHPSNLSQPIVSISNGNPLPAPQGMSGALTAVSSPNIFRDMSGMVQTAALAQAALEQATLASTTTGGQASENLSKGLEFTKELASQVIKMAGDYGQSLADTGFGVLTSGVNNSQQTKPSKKPVESAFKNISNAGTLFNKAKKMDALEAIAKGIDTLSGGNMTSSLGDYTKGVMEQMSGLRTTPNNGSEKPDSIEKSNSKPIQTLPCNFLNDNVPISYNPNTNDGLIFLHGFPINEATLTDEHKEVLSNIVKSIKSYGGEVVKIEGRASEEGTRKFNKKLSCKRVLAVREYLSNEFEGVNDIPDSLLFAYGEDKPIKVLGASPLDLGLQRSVFVTYQINNIDVIEVEPSTDVNATTKWSLSLTGSAGAGGGPGSILGLNGGAGVNEIIGKLKMHRKDGTEEIKDINITSAGLEFGAGVPFSATAALSDDFKDFETTVPLTFDSFDGAPIILSAFEAGVFIGWSESKIYFPTIKEKGSDRYMLGLNFEGMVVGQIQSIGSIRHVGFFNVIRN